MTACVSVCPCDRHFAGICILFELPALAKYFDLYINKLYDIHHVFVSIDVHASTTRVLNPLSSRASPLKSKIVWG
jgi:hypothetical protein